MDGMLFEDEQKKPRKQRITSAQVDAIYQAYPRHIAPADAKRAIKVALQKVDYATLLARVKSTRRGFVRIMTREPKQNAPRPTPRPGFVRSGGWTIRANGWWSRIGTRSGFNMSAPQR
jgi:hypothetical protein